MVIIYRGRGKHLLEMASPRNSSTAYSWHIVSNLVLVVLCFAVTIQFCVAYVVVRRSQSVRVVFGSIPGLVKSDSVATSCHCYKVCSEFVAVFGVRSCVRSS